MQFQTQLSVINKNVRDVWRREINEISLKKNDKKAEIIFERKYVGLGFFVELVDNYFFYPHI